MRAHETEAVEILAGEKLAYSEPFIGTAMTQPINIEVLHAQVQAMAYVRGTPDEVAQWREDMAESRANPAIEDIVLSADEDAMFEMMLEEGLPPALMPLIILTLYGQDTTAPDLVDAAP